MTGNICDSHPYFQFPDVQTLCSRFESSSLLTGDTSEYEALGEGGGAETTGAVDVPADLAGCEQSGNRTTLQIHALGLGVDPDTAGGVVNMRNVGFKFNNMIIILENAD